MAVVLPGLLRRLDCGDYLDAAVTVVLPGLLRRPDYGDYLDAAVAVVFEFPSCGVR